MNIYEFLLELNFWQWLVVVTIVAIVLESIVKIVGYIFGSNCNCSCDTQHDDDHGSG